MSDSSTLLVYALAIIVLHLRERVATVDGYLQNLACRNTKVAFIPDHGQDRLQPGHKTSIDPIGSDLKHGYVRVHHTAFPQGLDGDGEVTIVFGNKLHL